MPPTAPLDGFELVPLIVMAPAPVLLTVENTPAPALKTTPILELEVPLRAIAGPEVLDDVILTAVRNARPGADPVVWASMVMLPEPASKLAAAAKAVLQEEPLERLLSRMLPPFELAVNGPAE